MRLGLVKQNLSDLQSTSYFIGNDVHSMSFNFLLDLREPEILNL